MDHDGEQGHRWFQILSKVGWVNEACGVSGCATKRTRRIETPEWELVCGLCDRIIDGRPAGPCEACLRAGVEPTGGA